MKITEHSRIWNIGGGFGSIQNYYSFGSGGWTNGQYPHQALNIPVRGVALDSELLKELFYVR